MRHVLVPTVLSAGFEHDCAVGNNGSVECWGGNEWGQCDLGVRG